MRSDQSDAFCLTFKEPADGIYYPGSTWTQGRNRLFDAIRNGGYEYAIFIDDDAELNHPDGFRRFESLIDEFHPALATPRYRWHLRDNTDLSRRVQGIIASDAICFAFHRDTWPALLPYWPQFDSESWWNSQHIMNRIAAVLYPGGTVQFNELEVINPRNGPYPREGRCVAADRMILEMLKPQWKHLARPHESPESFESPSPLLRDGYRLSWSDVGRYFDMKHRYWSRA